MIDLFQYLLTNKSFAKQTHKKKQTELIFNCIFEALFVSNSIQFRFSLFSFSIFDAVTYIVSLTTCSILYWLTAWQITFFLCDLVAGNDCVWCEENTNERVSYSCINTLMDFFFRMPCLSNYTPLLTNRWYKVFILNMIENVIR